MPVSGDILLVVSTACVLAGGAMGYLFARSRQRSPGGPSPTGNSPAADNSDIDEIIRQLPLRLHELADELGTNPAVQQKLAEIDRLLQTLATHIERIIRDARIDSLTGLWNRRALDEQIPLQLSLAQRYGTPLSVVMVDIDHFKQLNDVHGHAVGDGALQHIARLLRAGLRDSDFVARFGGEEFVLLLPQTDLTGALMATERIRKTISESPLRSTARDLVIKVSMGVAQVRREDRPCDVLARADAALLQAKQAGRNQIQSESGSPDIRTKSPECAF